MEVFAMDSWSSESWNFFLLSGFEKDLVRGVEDSHNKIDSLSREVANRHKKIDSISQRVVELEKRVVSLEKMLFNYATAISQQEPEQAAKVLSNFMQDFNSSCAQAKSHVKTQTSAQVKPTKHLNESETKAGFWKTSGSNKYYYVNGTMIFNTWAQINGKWHYFTGNGKMAVNTVVDGYEIDADGEMHDSELNN